MTQTIGKCIENVPRLDNKTTTLKLNNAKKEHWKNIKDIVLKTREHVVSNTLFQSVCKATSVNRFCLSKKHFVLHGKEHLSCSRIVVLPARIIQTSCFRFKMSFLISLIVIKFCAKYILILRLPNLAVYIQRHAMETPTIKLKLIMFQTYF